MHQLHFFPPALAELRQFSCIIENSALSVLRGNGRNFDPALIARPADGDGLAPIQLLS
jgi:hypothetical protein